LRDFTISSEVNFYAISLNWELERISAMKKAWIKNTRSKYYDMYKILEIDKWILLKFSERKRNFRIGLYTMNQYYRDTKISKFPNLFSEEDEHN